MTVGESPLYFRQHTLWNFVNWRQYSELSPLAKVLFGESFIGEVPVTRIEDLGTQSYLQIIGLVDL
jgi:hypothetical protein